MDLALNNLRWLICHKSKPNQTLFLWVIWAPKIDKEMYRMNLRENPRPEVGVEKDQETLVS